jgi:hypothetical protein
MASTVCLLLLHPASTACWLLLHPLWCLYIDDKSLGGGGWGCFAPKVLTRYMACMCVCVRRAYASTTLVPLFPTPHCAMQLWAYAIAPRAPRWYCPSRQRVTTCALSATRALPCCTCNARLVQYGSVPRPPLSLHDAALLNSVSCICSHMHLQLAVAWSYVCSQQPKSLSFVPPPLPLPPSTTLIPPLSPSTTLIPPLLFAPPPSGAACVAGTSCAPPASMSHTRRASGHPTTPPSYPWALWPAAAAPACVTSCARAARGSTFVDAASASATSCRGCLGRLTTCTPHCSSGGLSGWVVDCRFMGGCLVGCVVL